MIERHYTTAEVAKLLACSTDTVLRLAQRGELHSIYVGTQRRYPESAIQAFIERNASRGPGFADVVPLRETRPSQTRRTG